MGKSIRGCDWTVRIDVISGLTLDRIKSWCDENKVTLCTYENPDNESPNPHCHMALHTQEISQETLRTRVKKVFGDLPYKSTDFATGVWDQANDNWLRYCCKGAGWNSKPPRKGEMPEVIYTTLANLSIKSFFDSWWSENEAKTKRIEEKKSKGNTTKDVIQECYEYLRPLKITNYYDAVEQATYYIMDQKEGKISDHIMIPMVQSVIWKLDRQVANGNAADRVISRLKSSRSILNIQESGSGILNEIISPD